MMKLPEPKRLPSGSYNIRLRLGGQEYSITESSSTECRNQARLIKSQYKAGKLEASVPARKKQLGELIDNYIKARSKTLSPSTIREYKSYRKNRMQGYMDKPVGKIKWQDLIDDEIEDGMSAKTVKNIWSLVTASLEHAGLQKPSVTRPAVMQSTRPWLDADQIKTFVKAIKGHDCEIAALLGLHSLRRSEIIGLTWNSVDLEAGMIKVEGSMVYGPDGKLTHKESTKTSNSRRVIPIMIPRLKEALEAIPETERTGYVVKAHPSTIRSQINRVCKASNLPEAGVHGMRHSFASLAHHVGLPEREAMLIGGWEDAQTMHKIYEHISAADKLKAENQIAAFFRNADENADEAKKDQ